MTAACRLIEMQTSQKRKFPSQWPVREVLAVPALRVPGLLLLGVAVANAAGHATVAALYRRDRA